MKTRHYIGVIGMAVAMVLAACDGLLRIDPEDGIDQSLAVNDRAGVEASIAAVYTTLKQESFYGNRLVGLGSALADDGQATNKSGRYNNEYRNLRNAHYNHWTGAYTALNRINIALNALSGIQDPSITVTDVARWEGELHFLRALFHFDLVKAYAYIPGAVEEALNRGGIPLVTFPITTIEGALTVETPRVAIEEAYDLIYTDLEDAIAKLPPLPSTGGTPAVIGRANQQAAQLLLSRVALYRRDYARVVALTNAVIGIRGGTLLNPANYLNGFSISLNPESLFEVQYQLFNENLGVNVSLQTAFTTLTQRMPDARRDSTDNYPGRTAVGLKTERGGFGDLVPTGDLLHALGITFTGNGSNAALITSRTADIRNMLFEVGSSFRGSPYIECTKYIGKNGDLNWDNTVVLRIAEAWLNRAEALAASGGQHNPAQALADVNTIRLNRGLPAISNLSGSGLIDEILLQRRLEFAFEGGHRFLDLKRRGVDINKPATGTTFFFNDVLLLPAIPQGDVDGSLGLIPQNAGH